ncbi:MAG: T9SS type B sorting domain-containing protein, partial [Saprospiraceae bacterium]|nr:T9SS type B sorting domain-containing protein [Saprospiraceae bacterium]
EGDITYTWTYTDCDGNTHDWVHTVTIEREDFTVPANTSVTVDCYDNIVLPAPPSVSDACGNIIIPTGPDETTPPDCEGDIIYTWNYEDCEGNTHDWTHTVTIEYEDFSVPANTSGTVDCYENIFLPAPPIVFDNCGVELIPTGPVESTVPTCEGDITYTWTYTDCEGNSHDWSHIITIEYEDFTLPAYTSETISCYDNIVLPDPPYAEDNCGVELIPIGPVESAVPTCEGDISYTWTYTDCEGNTHDWVHTVTIEREDFIVPISEFETFDCYASIILPDPPEVMDDCGNDLIPSGPVESAVPSCEGDITYTWTYTDCEGNTHDWEFIATIIRKDFIMPDDEFITVNCYADISLPSPPSVTDDCGNIITPVGPIESAVPSCDGDVSYTWTYTDCAGFSHDWIYTITIDFPDFTIPTPTTQTVECYADIILPTPPSVQDACGNTIIPEGPFEGTIPNCDGDIVYTWTYTDCEGNMHDWIHTITIEMPDFVMPANQSRTINCEVEAIEPIPPNVSDFCGFNIDPIGPTVSEYPECEGSIVYTWEYEDCNGNMHEWNFTYNIVILDFSLPVNENSIINCVDEAFVPIPPVVVDNCDNLIDPEGPIISDSPDCNGSIDYTWTYTDCIGNSHDWTYTFIVSIQDFSIPDDQSLAIDCHVDIIEPIFPYVEDYCGNELIPSGPTITQIPECNGSVTYTYVYTDCDGNTHDWNFIYIINIPDFDPPQDEEQNINCSSEAFEPTPPTVFDFCGNEITPTGPVISAIPQCEGEIFYRWNYTDCAGHSYDWTYTYYIQLEQPEIECLAPIEVTCYSGMVEAINNLLVDYNNGIGVTVHCDYDYSVTAEIPPSDPSCPTHEDIEFILTDECGNTHSCIQRIDIINEDPEFDMDIPFDVTVSCDEIPEPAVMTGSDDCGDVFISMEEDIEGDICSGMTITRSYIIEDECGYYNIEQQYITVNPPSEPSWDIIIEPSIQLNCDEAEAYSFPSILISNGQIGSCTISELVLPTVIKDYNSCGGTITVTWNYTDFCGTEYSQTQMVEVIPPQQADFLNKPQDFAVSCIDAESLIFDELTYSNGESGNCQISGTVPPAITEDYNACGGYIYVTWEVANLCDYTISHTQTITVNPSEDPDFINPPVDITIDCGDDLPPLEDLDYTNGIPGACGIEGIASGVSIQHDGYVEYIWTFNHACTGETLTHTQRIDITPGPDITLDPESITICDGESFNLGSINITDLNSTGPVITFHNGLPTDGSTVITDLNVTPSTTTTYYIKAVANGCEDIEAFTITVNPLPELVIPSQPTICLGETIDLLSVNIVDNNNTGATITFHSALPASSGNQINDTVLQPSSDQTIYVSADANGCTAVAILEISVDEVPFAGNGSDVQLCNIEGTVINFNDLLDPNADQGDWEADSGLTGFNPGTGILEAHGITAGNYIVLYITTLNTVCPQDTAVFNIQIFEETIRGDDEFVTVCNDGNDNTSLNFFNLIRLPSNTVGTWIDNDGSGVNLTDATDVSFLGIEAGTYIYSFIINGDGPCEDTETLLEVIVEQAPTITVTQVTCQNLSFYEVHFTSDQSTIFHTGGTIEFLGNESYRIYDIPVNESLEIDALDPITDCNTIVVIDPPNCECPEVLSPVSGGDKVICEGEITPELSVTVGVIESVKWYDAPNAGTLLHEGLTYTPTVTTPGTYTYYVAAVSDVDDQCESPVRTAVKLTIVQTPIAGAVVYSLCDDDNDGFISFNLASIIEEISSLNNVTVQFYETEEDAANDNNPLSTDFVNTTPDYQLIYASVVSSAGCKDIAQVELIVDPLPDVVIEINNETCSGANDGSIIITNQNGDATTYSLNGDTPQTDPQFTGLSSGQYTLTISNDFNCEIIEIIDIEPGNSITVDQLSYNCYDNGTESDPSDDFYTIEILVNASVPGSSNSYNLTIDGIPYGSYTYGSLSSFDVLATGNLLSLQIADSDDPSCEISEQIGPLTPCSNTCILTLDINSVTCNNNNTPSDPSDDFYTVVFNADAVLGGSSNTYEVQVNGTSEGIFTYGLGGTITIPADGQSVQISAYDSDDNSCWDLVDIGILDSCSDECLLSVEYFNTDCNDNGTETDPSDDFYTISFRSSVLNGGAVGQFVLLIDGSSQGTFDYDEDHEISMDANNSTLSIEIHDSEKTTCNYTTSIGPLSSCSSTCEVTITQVSTVCDDNGTVSDPSDDTYTVSFNAAAVNASSSFILFVDGIDSGTFDYGIGGSIILPANGQSVNLSFTDSVESTCEVDELIGPLNNCSTVCDLSIDLFQAVCNDNGTPSDPEDDYYTFTINASSLNGGPSGNYNVYMDNDLIGTAAYTTDFTFTHDADEIIHSLRIEDADDPTCFETTQTPQLSTCSGDCLLSIDSIITDCYDNGTPTDSSDDYYTVSLEITGYNPGTSGLFKVFVDGVEIGEFAYNNIAIFDLPADGMTHQLMIQDADLTDCSINTNLDSLTPCSDECALTIISYDETCNDNGTPSDPSDDYYTLTVNAEASNPGNTGMYNVLIDGVLVGSSDYSTPYSFDFIADGTNHNIRVVDADDPTCNDDEVTSIFNSCSDECQINIIDISLVCSDNGTPTDGNDDFYSVDITIEALNSGISGTYEIWVDNQYESTHSYTVTGSLEIPADGQSHTIEVRDTDIIGCSAIYSTESLISCSTTCDLTIDLFTLTCNDNNSPSDASDDFYDLIINASVVNGGTSGLYDVYDGDNLLGTTPYGEDFNGQLPSDGLTHNIRVVDSDIDGCEELMITEPLFTCSDQCQLDFNITEVCYDNDTPSDSGDDYYEITITPTVINPGLGNKYVVEFDGNFIGEYDYGSDALITSGADGINHDIVVFDLDDQTCMAQMSTSALKSCSDECLIIIYEIDSACNDAGTPTDGSDDFYSFSILTGASNGSSNNSFDLLVDGELIVSGTYGIVLDFEIPADGQSHEITVRDTEDNMCQTSHITEDLITCSDECDLNIISYDIVCDDNNTPVDASDDIIRITIDIDVVNNGVLNQYVVLVDGNILRSFDYGTQAEITLSPDGQSHVITVEDFNLSTCSDSFTTDILTTCSNECDLTIESAQSECNDNNTETEPNDDFINYTIRASAINPGPDNMYEVIVEDEQVALAAYNTDAQFTLPADGREVSALVRDVNHMSCNENIPFGSANPCSTTCDLTIDDFTTLCNDNGTPSLPDDDFITISIQASAFNQGSSGQYEVMISGQRIVTGSYGDYVTFDLPANGNAISATVRDVDDNGCSENIDLGQMTPCSDLCDLSINDYSIQCFDGGSPSDPQDDFYQITISASALNPGTSGIFEVVFEGNIIASGPYDSEVQFSLPAMGQQPELTVRDKDEITCNESIILDALIPCSDQCDLTIDEITSTCNDNGTNTDASDDFYTISLTASAVNGGASGSYEVVAEGQVIASANYDSPASFTLIADGSSIDLTIRDLDDHTCNETITVGPLDPCSTTCDLTISDISQVCNDNGTGTDPSDDFYEVSFNVSAVNGSTQYEVLVNGQVVLTEAYNNLAVIVLQADASTASITVRDKDISGCNADVTDIDLTPCSDDCSLSIINITEQCNDNGTNTDPSDDFYTISFDIDVTNQGVDGNYTVLIDGTDSYEFNYGVRSEVIIPADGLTHEIIVHDNNDQDCSAAVFSSQLVSCSTDCILTVQDYNATCDDAGTGFIQDDDFYIVELTVTAINGSMDGTYNVVHDGLTIGTYTYNEDITFNLPADNSSNTILEVIDSEFDQCNQIIDLGTLTPCSDDCNLNDPIVSAPVCDDNGTETDPSDDTYTFTVNISGINTASGWIADDPLNISGSYGQETTFGPYLISDGPLSFTITDMVDPGCTKEINITPPAPCSSGCTLDVIQVIIGSCNDNGTGTTIEDDTYSITIQVDANNTSGNQYNVMILGTQYGPFAYGEEITIDELPADGNDITVLIEDLSGICFTETIVSQDPCSECVDTVDAGQGGILTCADPSLTLSATTSTEGTVVWTTPGGSQINAYSIEAAEEGWYYAEAFFDNLCTDLDSVEVTVDENIPVADPGPDQMLTCLITEATLDGSGSTGSVSLGYTWLNESGNIISTEPIVTVSSIGTYYLIVTDLVTNCESAQVEVNVNESMDEPSALIFADPSNILDCVVTSILLFTEMEENNMYMWTTEDGRESEGQSIIVDESGMVTLTVIDTITGCSSFNTLNISDLEEYPRVDIEAPDPLSCLNTTITLDATKSDNGPNLIFNWYDPNGEIINNEKSLILEVEDPGTYILESIDTINGCLNLDTIFVDINIASGMADAGEDQFLDCIDNQAQLTGIIDNLAGGTYRWSTENGVIVSNAQSLNPTVGAAGTYYLEVIHGISGCVSVDSVEVNILPDVIADADIEVLNPICKGEANGMINIGTISGGIPPYEVSLNGSPFGDQRLFEQLSPGNYRIIIRDSNGCQIERSYIIEDGNTIEIDIDTEIDYIELGESILLEGSTSLPDDQIQDILWSPEDVVDCPDCLTTLATPYESTRFNLLVTDVNGCQADAEVEIRVDRRAQIYVPNIFTPNNDGENDFFTVYTSDVNNIKIIKKLLIFDRWGELVARIENFEPNIPQLGWDGMFRGQNVNPGVFAWVVEAVLIDGTTENLSGDVTVLK